MQMGRLSTLIVGGLAIALAASALNSASGRACVSVQVIASQKTEVSAAGDMDVEGYITTADGVRLFCRVVGDGPQTVLIPGRLFLFDALQTLLPGRRLIFYDMRSRGKSDAVHDPKRETIQDDVRDLESVRQIFHAGKVSLIGYSYLGMMVMLYAKEHAEHVDRIVQLDPVPMSFDATYPAALSQDFMAALDADAVKHLDELRKQGYNRSSPRDYCEQEWNVTRFALVGDPGHVDRAGKSLCDMPNEWPPNLNQHFAASIDSIKLIQLTPQDVKKISMPVLTIHGDKDRNAPYGGGREWAMSLPDARLLTVKGGAHQSFSEYPEIVLPAVDQFLKGTWPAGVERVTALVPPSL
jgi:pimeloyl-ACP methyl ester carboxylesterase